MPKFVFFFSFFLFANFLHSQQEDTNWYIGWGYKPKTTPETKADSTWGGTNFDFNYSPTRIYYDNSRSNELDATNAIISDQNGKVQLYTNGMQLYNGNHEIIEDTINFGNYWMQNATIYEGNLKARGFPIIQGALIIPDPADSMRYYVLYSQFSKGVEWWDDYVKGLYYSHVDMRMNEGKGGLLSRDIPMVEDSLVWGGLSSCRHANGRDWWVMQVGKNREDFYQYLITPDGLTQERKITFNGRYRKGYPAVFSSFSPNGSHYAVHIAHDTSMVIILDFDRSTGDMQIIHKEEYTFTNISQGLIFDQAGRYLYLSNRTAVYPDGENVIYQYNLESSDIKSSKTLVAVYDGYEYFYPEDANDPPFPWQVNFGYMGLAPDGKIYICPTSGGNRMMSAIEFPHEGGEACEVRQHSIKIPTSFTRTMPNFPNYRLGPLDGSPADTLGLDNHPIAKYRYEQDTLDHLTVRFTDLSYFRPETWHWDMGDGTTTTEQYPYHSYEKNGVYEVCLTVSNENSSNTSCRTLTIGTSSTEDKDINIEVSTYPNPFVDQVLITLGEYIPQNGYFVVYDISGHEVARTRIYYGWNDIDLAHLSSGTYIWQMMDRGVLLKSGKMVK